MANTLVGSTIATGNVFLIKELDRYGAIADVRASGTMVAASESISNSSSAILSTPRRSASARFS